MEFDFVDEPPCAVHDAVGCSECGGWVGPVTLERARLPMPGISRAYDEEYGF